MRTECTGLTPPTITPSPSPAFFKATPCPVNSSCRGQIGVGPENRGQGSWVRVQASEPWGPLARVGESGVP